MASKKYIFLFSILLSMVGSKALAYDFAVENADGVTIYYNYINDGTELEVTSSSNTYRGSVVIPEEVTYMNRTRKVTSIGQEAFRNCSRLTSVTIPNSVTSIGYMAFEFCSGLTSLTIPNGVTSIDYMAFAFCSGLTSVTIGNSVTSISNNAFAECYSLTSVNISDIAAWCIIRFGDNPLQYAHHLFLNGEEIKNLVIPNSVTSIGYMAFAYCSGLTSVTIPNSVTSIGKSSFSGCFGLTSLTIPNSVTVIDDEAFNHCSGLTSVTIGNSVTRIGASAFYGCDIPEVISKIENPFEINGKSSAYKTFSLNTFVNATLYVPVGTIDKYKSKAGWKDFQFIEEGNGSDDIPPSKCEKPTITFKGGKLIFSCATEGVTYQYNITASSVKSGAGNDIDFTPKYTITTYATKDGYEDSETATLEVSVSGSSSGTNGDVNGDGLVNAADIVKITNIIMGE